MLCSVSRSHERNNYERRQRLYKEGIQLYVIKKNICSSLYRILWPKRGIMPALMSLQGLIVMRMFLQHIH